jgi:hypothetical protein
MACDTEYEEPVAPADIQLAHRMSMKGLHYWYLLDRIAPEDDPARQRVAEWLTLYTPRNLYAIAELVRRLDRLDIAEKARDALRWSILYALDLGSKLHADPSRRPGYKPRSLRPPKFFLEINVWLCLEHAWQHLAQWGLEQEANRIAEARGLLSGQDLPLWSNKAAQLYVGMESIRQLAQDLSSQQLEVALAEPPQFDPVYWPLAYVWSGCLYGTSVAAPLRGIAKRGAGSWTWYMQAMQVAFKVLKRLLDPEGRLFLYFDTVKPAYNELLSLAAGIADLESVAGRFLPHDPLAYTTPLEGQAGIYVQELSPTAHAKPPNVTLTQVKSRLQRAMSETAIDILKTRGEPVTATLMRFLLWQEIKKEPIWYEILALLERGEIQWDFLRNRLQETLSGASALHWLSVEPAAAAGAWWLATPPKVRALDDRVEAWVRGHFKDHATVPMSQIEQERCDSFSGILTPEPQLIEHCLAAYATPKGDSWETREKAKTKATAKARRVAVRTALADLGRRLGYMVQTTPLATRKTASPPTVREATSRESQGFDLLWLKQDGVQRAFLYRETAEIDTLLAPLGKKGAETTKHYLVIADARASLLAYKVQRNLWRQAQIKAQGWRFIKARHILALASAEQLDEHEWAKVIGLHPIVEQDEAQPRLFDSS